MRIGPIQANEYAALASLMREVIEPLGYYNEEARRVEVKKHGEAELRALVTPADPQAILVARDEHGLAGFCLSRYDDATIWLAWFGAAARARGRGVGSALIAALKATLPSRGAHKIW